MNIIYNRAERRLRAFWRILIQSLVFLLSTSLLNLIAGYTLVAVFLLTGQIPFSSLSSAPQLNQALQPLIYRFPFLYILSRLEVVILVLLLFYLFARFLDRRSFRDYGFHLNAAWWRDLGFGLFLGAILMAGVFVFERSIGWLEITGKLQTSFTEMAFGWGLSLTFVNYILVGVREELLSRGYQTRNLAEGLNGSRLNPRAALLIAYFVTSSVFGLMHMFNANFTWISGVNIALAGLMLGLGFMLTGELAIPIGLHITWNFFQGNIFGFPVSGSSSGLSVIAIQQSGPVAWTGGAFGPEGGLIGVLAMLLALLLIYAWVRWTRRKASLHTALAVYSRNPVDQPIVDAPVVPSPVSTD